MSGRGAVGPRLPRPPAECSACHREVKRNKAGELVPHVSKPGVWCRPPGAILPSRSEAGKLARELLRDGEHQALGETLADYSVGLEVVRVTGDRL